MFAIKSYLGAFVALFLVLMFSGLAVAAELVMVEQNGCEWCERWNQEIAPAYPKTTEGKFAPLRRVDLRDMPPGLDIARRVNFTPTFLIVENGAELARLEGYPGADFFWPVLANLLMKHTNYNPATGEEG